jgi:transcriptional regulator with XRE-family HTH domain
MRSRKMNRTVAMAIPLEEFANSVDLHVTQLSRIERGETNVTSSDIFRLAKIFKVSPSDLIDFNK